MSSSGLPDLYERIYHAIEQREDVSVIETLVNEDPSVLKWQKDDGFGFTLLHCACCVTPPCPFELIQYLVQTCPQSAELQLTPGNETPLHCVLRNEPSIETIQLLLNVYPEAAAIMETDYQGGMTPLQIAICCNCSLEIIELILQAFPPAIAWKDPFGITALQEECGAGAEYAKIQLLAQAWPIACLIWGKEIPNIHIADVNELEELQGYEFESYLPLDRAQEEGARPETIACLTEWTIEAMVGMLDAMVHFSSSFSESVIALCLDTFESDDLATVKKQGMVTHEMIDLVSIKKALKATSIKDILNNDQYVALINGFIQMNLAGRKEAIQSGAHKIYGLHVSASVCDNLSCLYVHLRENSNLWR